AGRAALRRICARVDRCAAGTRELARRSRHGDLAFGVRRRSKTSVAADLGLPCACAQKNLQKGLYEPKKL
ncbi:hypothetical protein, partial [Burkholderia multivorans]|uniref:hypothetical protein n=1 Tax=Burkholderia multivorans TaxID=87883 RepID=UPI001C658843